MARPTEVDAKKLEYIKSATNLKMSSREIAEQIGMSHATVQRYQRKLGLTKPNKPLLAFN
ncbi:hypothetical protein EX461_23930 [Vibrio parahaemolyticus]|nr:hypothetical protein [Vibrio parahaemolyticus]EJG0013992.1 hypothetical protein [Vibrio parahaemolyticus]EJG0782033.1 hypothetical protein [Vibrio parahaemolyticus]EJS9799243.1 hypothetical protein [Vibrio parahaemolyticus]